MATKIATYKFDREESYYAAKASISNVVGGSGWDYSLASDCGYIYIYDDCEKVTEAGQICRAHGGVPYNY